MADVGIGSRVIEAMVLFVVTSGGFGLSSHLMKRYFTETEERIKNDFAETETRIKNELAAMRGENEQGHREILKYSKEAAMALKDDIDDLYDKHHQCREDLPKNYAGRDEVGNLWKKADQLTGEVSFLKGKQNGR